MLRMFSRAFQAYGRTRNYGTCSSQKASSLRSTDALHRHLPQTPPPSLVWSPPNDFALTALYLSGTSSILPMIDPRIQIGLECPTEKEKVNSIRIDPETIGPKSSPTTDQVKDKSVEDPISDISKAPKYAHRMLRIKKRKIKKHWRRKRAKKNNALIQTGKMNRMKKKEIAFRVGLMEVVSSAKKFDPEQYISEYLEEYHKPLIPRTYEGKNKPEWYIKELMAKNELKEKEAKGFGEDILTHEPLVMPGETVEQFKERVSKKYGWNK